MYYLILILLYVCVCLVYALDLLFIVLLICFAGVCVCTVVSLGFELVDLYDLVVCNWFSCFVAFVLIFCSGLVFVLFECWVYVFV